MVATPWDRAIGWPREVSSTAFTIRPVEYYYANVRDEPEPRTASSPSSPNGESASSRSPPSPAARPSAQLALFPDHPNRLTAEATAVGLDLDGPYHALLVQGDDELGALASVHARLVDARVESTPPPA